MTKITYHSIAKDDWDSGDDFYTCEDCGRHLRFAMKVNGVIYGLNCGAKVAGIRKPSKKVVRWIEFQANALNDETLKMSTRYQAAFQIIQLLKLDVPYSTEEQVVELVQEIIN